MSKSANVVKTASTQEHLDITDIRDDIVLLKSGAACAIVRTTAVNFGLLSETEQDSIIYAYAGFLNSLSFAIQILIQSKKMDITSYLELIRQQELKQTNPALKAEIGKYHDFVASIIQENKVLDKSFYIVVPFSSLELGIKGGTTNIFGSSKKAKINYSPGQLLEKAKVALTPRRDNIIRLLSRMGLKAESLNTTELIKLFYEIYNPEEAIGQKIVSTDDYQSPLVQPVVDISLMKPQMPGRQPQPGRPAPQARPRPVQPRAVSPHAVAKATAQPAARRPGAPAANSAITAQDVQSVLSRLQSEVTKLQKGS